MKSLSYLILPGLLGLVAGIGHGVVSHYAGLPLSLGDQLAQPLAASLPFKD